jgi:hypothetical protein
VDVGVGRRDAVWFAVWLAGGWQQPYPLYGLKGVGLTCSVGQAEDLYQAGELEYYDK